MARPANPDTKPKDKAGDFRRLAETRVGKALSAIAVVGNLASKASYEYNDFQVEQIKAALIGEVEKTMARFGKTEETAAGFKLADAPVTTEAPAPSEAPAEAPKK